MSKSQLHWKYLLEKGKSGYFCQDARICSTPSQMKDGNIEFVERLLLKFYLALKSNCLQVSRCCYGFGEVVQINVSRRKKQENTSTNGGYNLGWWGFLQRMADWQIDIICLVKKVIKLAPAQVCVRPNIWRLVSPSSVANFHEKSLPCLRHVSWEGRSLLLLSFYEWWSTARCFYFK